MWFDAPKTKLGKPADMWALGVSLFEIFTQSAISLPLPPPGSVCRKRWSASVGVEASLSRIESYSADSPQFTDLVRRCLEVDPKFRISAAEAVAHPFFGTSSETHPPPPPPLNSGVADVITGCRLTPGIMNFGDLRYHHNFHKHTAESLAREVGAPSVGALVTAYLDPSHRDLVSLAAGLVANARILKRRRRTQVDSLNLAELASVCAIVAASALGKSVIAREIADSCGDDDQLDKDRRAIINELGLRLIPT